MFSTRTSFDLTLNRLAAAAGKRRASGLTLLDLTESNPTSAGLAYPEDLLAVLAASTGLTYAPDPRGMRVARAAVSLDFARRGFTVAPERLVLTASSSESYALLFKLLCDPGDEVLVPRPGYPLFDFLAQLEAIAVRPYALAWDGEWHVDLPALAATLTPRTRAVVLVNPGNPTGAFLKQDELAGLQRLAGARGLALISDEVFADYAFREDARRAASVAADGEALAFSLGGISKSLGLPQLKLGWIAASGPAALREPALARLEVEADTYLSVGTPVQLALPSLLQRREELQTAIHSRLAQNLAVLRSALTPGSPISLLDPEGGWYVTLRVPATEGEEALAVRLVEEEGVLVHPGFFFDFPTEAFLVLSLLTPPALFADGVLRIARSLVL
jgi:alanine-synthesizing transaminase